MSIKLAIATYGELEKMVSNIPRSHFPQNVELIHLNLVLSDLSTEALRLEKLKSVDAFVASGGNANTLEKIITTVPVITIVPTGYDIIDALCAASLRSNRIGCIFYEHATDEAMFSLMRLKDFLDVELEIKSYSTRKELERIITDMKNIGIEDIIGGSLAIQAAAEKGLFGHYFITESGLISAIDKAIEIIKLKRSDEAQSRLLSTILDNTSEGIVAIDGEDNITCFNKSAEKLFSIEKSAAIDKKVNHVLENTRLNIVRQTGVEELNQIQNLHDKKILTNRIPLFSDGKTIGALATFNNIHDIEQAEAQIRHNLYSRGLTAKYTFNDIIGKSSVTKKTVDQAQRFAKSDVTILITGESGTGKELFAQSIHNYGSRKGKPFVAVNCAAMSSQLLESELFGYEEGAFTGAKRGGKRGVFELADSGTVFLDEIAEMSLETQAHLLRVIEQREVMRVGGEKIRPVDIRIITATNKDLKAMVNQGTFREDLYYRINVLRLRIPPLRERREDIPILLTHYIKLLCPHAEPETVKLIANDKRLVDYYWTGNIRELRNLAERFAALGNIKEEFHSVIDEFSNYMDFDSTQSHDIDHFAKVLTAQDIVAALSKCNGNKTVAADILGMSRSTLWRKMKELGISSKYEA